MNLMGKILTVAIFVMSILFMALALSVVATENNWKEEVEGDNGLKARLTLQQQVNTELVEQLEDSKNLLASEQAARRHALAALQTKLEQIVQVLEGRESTLTDLQAAHGTAVQALETAENNLQKFTDEVAVLRVEIEKAQQNRDEQFNQVVSITDLYNQAEGLKARLEERNLQLAAQIAKMTNVLAKNGLTEDTPVDGIPPLVDGVVLAVNNNNRVEISIGDDEGLRRGHHLEVYRNNAYLGRIIILETAPDRAVGEILKDFRKGAIKKGDKVATKIS